MKDKDKKTPRYLSPAGICREVGISASILKRLEEEGRVHPVVLFTEDEKPNRKYELEEVVAVMEAAKVVI